MAGFSPVAATGGKRAKSLLFQSLSMNLQKGKAPCVIGTVAHHRKLEEIYNLGTITHKKISLKPNFLSSFLLFYNILSSLIQIRLLFQTFQHFSFSFYSCPAVGLFERMYP